MSQPPAKAGKKGGKKPPSKAKKDGGTKNGSGGKKDGKAKPKSGSKSKASSAKVKSKTKPSGKGKGGKPGTKGGVKKINSKTAAIKAPPEVISKNKEGLDKILALLIDIKPEQVTRTNKDDLDKVQVILKNIAFRDHAVYEKVRDVQLTEYQRGIVKLIAGQAPSEDTDAATHMHITQGKPTDKGPVGVGGPSQPDKIPSKINFPYEKLEFVVTKASVKCTGSRNSSPA